MSAKPRLRFDGIQSLRFLAALLVVVTHATHATESLDPSTKTWYFGTIGVDIFFVISGFVMAISTVELTETKGGWKYFGMRRIVRIVPMYWIATTVKLLTLIVLPSAALNAVVRHSDVEPGRTLLSYFFLPSRNASGDVMPVLGVGWTLTFEMFFYFVFTVALLVRVKPIWFCAVVLSLCALGNIARPDEWVPALVYLDPILLYFLAGMAVGQWQKDGSIRRLIVWMGYIFGVWLFILLADSKFTGLDGVIMLRHVSVVALIIAVVTLEPRFSGRVPKPIVYMGNASYTLYLFHPMVVPIAPAVLGVIGLRIGGVSVVLSILASVTAAALIYRFVERPITRYLQERLPYVRRHAAATLEPGLGPDVAKS